MLADALQTDAYLLHIRGQQGQTREGGRPYGKALARGGGGVAQRVEGIGAVAHFLAQARHFSVATCVVGYGSVGIGGQGDAQRGEHAHGGHAYAVKAHEDVSQFAAGGYQIGGNDAAHHGHYGHSGGEHAQAQTRDDDGGRTRLAAF